jgi:hypothetical protein
MWCTENYGTLKLTDVAVLDPRWFCPPIHDPGNADAVEWVIRESSDPGAITGRNYAGLDRLTARRADAGH